MSFLARKLKINLRQRRASPPAVLAVIYAAFIVAGAVILYLLPDHSEKVSFSDALFTAVSAVTVTGLVVVDTGTEFNLLGQIVIAVLIQAGGLGLMTFAALMLSMLGLQFGMPQRMVLRDELGQSSLHELGFLVRIVIIVALACEALGAVALSFVFVPAYGWGEGIWQAIFHSISAFNNAGFSLFSNSLSAYATNPVVNITIPALFIIGGLGFVVLADLYRKRSWTKLTLHSKLMLTGTAVLIASGFIMFAALEWTNPYTLGTIDSVGGKLWASWFQAVTPRTAGFNTLDYAEMNNATTLMTITMMLVGGGPTSTAGGIKVTTLIVLLVATLAFFRRQERLNIFGRSLGVEEVMKVLALTVLSLFIVLLCLFAMSITWEGDFLDLLFEVTSAFGTVGLSRGATAELDEFQRAMIMAIMFIGRLGPLTLGFFLATRSKPLVRYPAGEVYLG